MVEVRRKDGEPSGSFLFRFSKKVRHSGVLIEARRRRFKTRPQNRRKRQISAAYRSSKRKEVERKKKLGLL